MYFSFTDVFINLLSIIVLTIIIVIAIRNKKKQGAIQLAWLIFFLLIWAIGTFFEMSVIKSEIKILWRNITQIGVFMTPLAMIAFVRVYTDDKSKIIKGITYSLLFIQITTILLIFTNPYHHLMRINIEVIDTGKEMSIHVIQTTLGMIVVSLNYIIVTLAEIKLVIFRKTISKHLKKQVLLVMIGMLLPLVFGVIKGMWLDDMGIVIPISALFIPGGLCLVFGIFRYELLSISPIARDKVFNTIDAGLIVFNPEGKIIDINYAVEEYFQGNVSKETIENLIINNYPRLYKAITNMSKDQMEVYYEVSNRTVLFQIKVHVLETANKLKVGTVIILRDITREKEKTTELIKKAEYDGLTKVYNRAHFVESIDKIMKIDNIRDNEVFLLVLDLDYFKNINDTYGHSSGDYILKNVVIILAKHIREFDMIGRLGGEEFGVLLRKCNKDNAMNIANRINRSIENHEFNFHNNKMKITASIGVVGNKEELDKDFDSMFIKADKALYQAKEAGRNTVKYYE